MGRKRGKRKHHYPNALMDPNIQQAFVGNEAQQDSLDPLCRFMVTYNKQLCNSNFKLLTLNQFDV